ncbi:MAG: hypothetical protein FWD17_14285 [Polyangiaceae bacterium]|nr:hypothetical protein [Polyangiaceae bacterium]
MNRLFLCIIAAVILAFSRPARAEPSAPRPHGPAAPDDQFPSHVFRLEARSPDRVQLGFNFGLSQPIVAHGFNAAVDARYKRLFFEYSHGQGLDFTPFDTTQERNAGVKLGLPWTTGGGVGVVLIDELWVLADVKVHHFTVDSPADHLAYTNVTIGAEIGWRYFVWKGFNIAFVGRYWPNVYSTAGKGVTLHAKDGSTFVDPPAPQGYHGLFGNVLVGWLFDL